MDIKKTRTQANIFIGIFLCGVGIHFWLHPGLGMVVAAIGAIALLFFAPMLIHHSMFSGIRHQQVIVDLPPKKDIVKIKLASAFTASLAELPEKDLSKVLNAIYKAKRFTSTSVAAKKVVLVLCDKWNEEKSLHLIRTTDGKAEFEVNRVYYRGTALEQVLELAGI